MTLGHDVFDKEKEEKKISLLTKTYFFPLSCFFFSLYISDKIFYIYIYIVKPPTYITKKMFLWLSNS